MRVVRRSGGRLTGQLIAFSALNVEAARLARHGYHQAAVRVARAAEQLEAAAEFRRLWEILSELPDDIAEGVLGGVLPGDAPPALADTLRTIARRAEQMRAEQLRAAESPLAEVVSVIAGRIAEVHEDYVLLVRSDGPPAAVPRWMAAAAHRSEVGDVLMLVTDHLDPASAVVEAVPAIDYEELEEPSFSPFGRGDSRVRRLTRADERLLSGIPEPLTILVPVLVGT
jgi:hypothetical protein